jgi:hypothetical protein
MTMTLGSAPGPAALGSGAGPAAPGGDARPAAPGGAAGLGARLGAEAGEVGAANNAALVRQITTAVRTSPLTAALPAQRLTVTDVRVSATDPNYAAAHVVPPPGTTDRASALLHRSNGRWTLVELGTAGVGSGTVTPAVRADLSSVLGPPRL